MNQAEREAAFRELEVVEQELARRNSYKFHQYFPDTGPLRRELYPGATTFFEQGVRWPERLILGGNRVGKTDAAAYEMTCHLTGRYPKWWKGRRFTEPIQAWAAGDTAATTRDIMQKILYGKIPESPKTGMIPAHLIVHTSNKNAVSGALESLSVRHISGGLSTLQFKSYDQRRQAFQGTSQHVIWLDEECPEDIYGECVLRTLTVKGIVMVTFTPLEGLTPFINNWLQKSIIVHDQELVDAYEAVFGKPVKRDTSQDDLDDPNLLRPASQNFIENTSTPEFVPLTDRNKAVVMIGWDEVPHLDKQAQQQLLASILPYQRDARTKGIPTLGSGVVYTIQEPEIVVKRFQIPDHWKRGYGMDVGWNWTVAVFVAYDPDTDMWYAYHEYVRGKAEPPIHAAGIRAVGSIPGRIDPAANQRSQKDGTQLVQLYRDQGLDLDNAMNAVEKGIAHVWTLLSTGHLKVFDHLQTTLSEYRMYCRDDKGRIIKSHDHCLDALRYAVNSGSDWMQPLQAPKSAWGNSLNASPDPYGFMG